MTTPSDPRLIGADEANRLHQLALQREAMNDAWQLSEAALKAALAGLRRGLQRLTGWHDHHPEPRQTASITQEPTTTQKEPDPCPPCN